MLHNQYRQNEVEILVRVALGRRTTKHTRSYRGNSRPKWRSAIFGALPHMRWKSRRRSSRQSRVDHGRRRGRLCWVSRLTRGATGPLTEPLKRKFVNWMPDAIHYRAGVYGAMADWKADDQLVECLWHGLFNEEFENRKLAGRALVLVSRKIIRRSLTGFLSLYARRSMLKSPLRRCPLSFLADQLCRIGRCNQPSRKNLLFRRFGLQQSFAEFGRAPRKMKENLKALLSLADSRRYFFPSYGGEDVQALVEGWPNSTNFIIWRYQSARQRGRECELGGDIAKAYLLSTSKLKLFHRETRIWRA